jgi:hypothetical protein
MKRFILFAIAAVICLTALGSWAADSNEAELKKALKDKNKSKIQKTAEQIAQNNNEQSFQTLVQAVKGLAAEEMEYYWIILSVMSNFSNSDTVNKIADYIIKNKTAPLSKDLLYALQGNKRRDVIPALDQILQKGTDEMKLMALDHLAEVYFKDAVRVLIDFMRTLDDKKDVDWARKTAESLSSVAGLEKGPYVQTWVSWWEAVKDKDEAEVVKPMKGSTSDTGTAADHMGYKRNTAFNRLKGLPKDKIIVVSALDSCRTPAHADHNFDHVEAILEKFGIPHTVVKKKDFDTEAYDIKEKWFIGINCNFFKDHCTGDTCFATQEKGEWRTVRCGGKDNHFPHSTRFSDKTVKKVAEWVANGGFLFSEDAVIEELLEREFKGAVRHSTYLTERTVKIFPAPGASTHPYLRGVFEKPEKPPDEMPMDGGGGMGGDSGTSSVKDETRSVKVKSNVGKASWKIDNDSPDLVVAKPEMVTVLIVSPQLGSSKEWGGAPVAITFAYSADGGARQVPSTAATGGSGYSGVPMSLLKAGRVLHVMSHFGKQESGDDEFPLQNLIVNFMIELSERKLGQARKK